MSRLTKTQNDQRIDEHKIRAYQNHVQALGAERDAIAEFGAMSDEAKEAEKHSRKTRRAYNLWAKK